MKQTDPEVRAKAVEAVRKGINYRAIARAAGVSHTAVKRWAKAAGVGPNAILPPAAPHVPPVVWNVPTQPEAPPQDGLEPLSDADTLACSREMRDRMLALARRAEIDGNHSAARGALRDAGALQNLIGRLEKDARESADTLRTSMAEVDAARERLRDAARAKEARGILCERCSRELSIEWGDAREKIEQAAAGGS